jgi:uncharacterized protein DUF262/uncharacterized protein DUF1524
VKADTLDLATIFGKTVRYNVPLFQRPYVWKREEQWEPLWEDVRAVADRLLDDTTDNDSISHFLGAVVLEQTPNPAGKLETRNVIDGQQRLTTLQLLIAATRTEALSRGLTTDEVLPLERLVFNERALIKSADDRLKLLPTNADRQEFAAALDFEPGTTLPKPDDRGVLGAYGYFRRQLAEYLDADPGPESTRSHIEALGDAYWKLLQVVVIDLEARENAQIIFETLNARGTPLLAADLVKNAAFRSAAEAGTDLDELYERYWKQLDIDWWRAQVRQGRLLRPRIDVFLYHWLTMRLVREGGAQRLYLDFRELRRIDPVPATEVLHEISTYARIYATFEGFRAGTDGSAGEQRFFQRLDILDLTTAYPFLLWMYGPDGVADPADRDRIERALEAWLVHRMILRRPAKSYTQVFMELITLGRKAKAAGALSSATFLDFLRSAEADRSDWPKKQELLDRIASMSAYTELTRARLRMLLLAIEGRLRTTKSEAIVIGGDLTIEHVLPQDWEKHWPLPADQDSIDGPARRNRLKHTIGNLTLATTSLNPAMSNAAWPAKREALRTHSLLVLSKEVVDRPTWDESEIETRTQRLAEHLLEIWPAADDPSWT